MKTKVFYFRHSYVNTSPIGNDTRKLDKEFSELIREDCKVLCFSEDHEIYFGSLLSKMWAHYGGNHKGVCLELNKEAFIKENENNFDFSLMKKITYYAFDRSMPIIPRMIDHEKIREVGREVYLKNIFRDEHLDYLFFTKNKEWESECEIRLLYFSDKKENEYCSIRSSLTNIHLGLNFHESYLPSIRNLIKNTNIEIKGTDYGDVGLVSRHLSE